MTGICDFFAITGSASASSWLGTATRTIWQPDAVSSAICCSVALMSAVGVVVIDWTETGASPPTATEPTWICRELRRTASGSAGCSGIPRVTDIRPVSLAMLCLTCPQVTGPDSPDDCIRCGAPVTRDRDVHRPQLNLATYVELG